MAVEYYVNILKGAIVKVMMWKDILRALFRQKAANAIS